ncbi:MFS transporter [Hymenobacter perfusus]|uniref:MFS transporter n=1 Tax=Hymenobacter perfusus TaxID=1236770 RepID=A0A428K8C2_9BACT|nr:MFS transporter [Hymenobacter perfusus]RSK42630.1 MFS transporter [Hymenobacter perfusus]
MYPPLVPPPSLRTPFLYAVFRAVWLASVVSNIGTWMQNVAGVWLVTTLTTSVLLVALMQAATSLPAFLLSLPAGALGDLVDRRRLLLFTQAFMGVVAFVLGGLTLAGQVSALGVLGFTFLLGLGSAINAPIWQTVTTELVPRPVLPFAITLNGVSNNIARAVGPALGGLIIAHYSPGYVFLLNGISFVGTWVVVRRWQRPPEVAGGSAESFLGAVRTGLRYVRYSPGIYAVLVRTFAFAFGASAMWALLSVVTARRLHLSSGSYGVLLSWLGAGAIAGAFLLGRVGNRLPYGRRVLLGSGVFVGTNLGLAFMPSEYGLFPVMFLSGVAWLTAMTSFSTTVQLAVPRWVQARIVSIFMLVFQAGLSMGSIAWGELADRTTLVTALVAAAAWMLLSLLLAWLFPMPAAASLDLEPAATGPALPGLPNSATGPVAVLTEYTVAPADQPAFRRTAARLTRRRLRDGALRAGILAEENQLTEYYSVASYEDYERQHHRFTREDAAVQQQLATYHQGPEPPRCFLTNTPPSNRLTPPLPEPLLLPG